MTTNSRQKPDLLIAQPVMTGYRLPLFRELAKSCRTLVVCSPVEHGEGFDTSPPADINVQYHNTVALGPFHYQSGIISSLIRHKPSLFLFAANPRNLAIWPALILCRLMGIRSFAHGHGAYNKKAPGFFLRMVYRTLARISTRYICYTTLSQQTMLAMGCNPGKLRVANNTLYNDHALPYEQKEFNNHGLLFIGRLRDGSRLELLIKALQELIPDYPDLTLHIIGDGKLAGFYQSLAEQSGHIKFYGRIDDARRITDISKHCILGVYPGDAGLSVVHYMSLSLPAIVHNDIYTHMGPEPSYIEDGYNGLTFQKDDATDLASVLNTALADPETIQKLARHAWASYQSLSDPGLGQQFLAIFSEAKG